MRTPNDAQEISSISQSLAESMNYLALLFWPEGEFYRSLLRSETGSNSWIRSLVGLACAINSIIQAVHTQSTGFWGEFLLQILPEKVVWAITCFPPGPCQLR
ncbi:hypothetical protein FLAG1_03342 [Fusarium langsethiae]|uniref:Uncharacterized protein n=1 Tax=Fusarium langsethiae TaxID=179993 RepID=A0A0M9F119_FUSLA|nr:hypothetical protein FLAG1_03342 [Fusarium langsethiae]